MCVLAIHTSVCVGQVCVWAIHTSVCVGHISEHVVLLDCAMYMYVHLAA